MAEDRLGYSEARLHLIFKEAPFTLVRRIGWSGGETDVLELGSGAPLLLIHGGFSSSCEWVPIIERLAVDHHVGAIDQPGHGGADPFDYSDVDLNEHGVRFIGDVLEALAISRTAIMANSIGGLLAARFAARRPERVSDLVFAGFPVGLRRRPPLMFRLLALPVVPRLAFGNPTPKGSRKFMGQGLAVAHPELLSDELVDCDVANTQRHLESFLTLVKRLAGLSGLRRSWLLGDAWRDMPEGTTILWGENEPWASPQWGVDVLTNLGAEIRIVPIPNAGHLPWWDEPELVVHAARQVLRS